MPTWLNSMGDGMVEDWDQVVASKDTGVARLVPKAGWHGQSTGTNWE